MVLGVCVLGTPHPQGPMKDGASKKPHKLGVAMFLSQEQEGLLWYCTRDSAEQATTRGKKVIGVVPAGGRGV